MRTLIQAQLSSSLDSKIVTELLDAHGEAKRNYYLGGLRLSEVEGGRFCEAVFRILEQITTGSFTPLGTQISTDQLINRLSQIPSSAFHDSVRLHIPRALRLVYDIRNKRDAAHLADGIDPNLQDATLVVNTIDWILAELIRLYHNVSPNEASKIVNDIVEKEAPIVQDFDGFLKVLDPNLQAGDFCLVLLYHRGTIGATLEEITQWIRPTMRTNIRRTLINLANIKDLIHFNGTRYFITRLGEQEIERRKLIIP
jgi:hypothetical protein